VLRWCLPPAVGLLIRALTVPLLVGGPIAACGDRGGARTFDALLPNRRRRFVSILLQTTGSVLAVHLPAGQ
jgi:hypothetical protein